MISLTNIKLGKRARIQTIDAGHKLQARLAAMGLIPGVELRVIKNDPFIVAVNGCRLVLGRGMACKINVCGK